MSTNNKRPPPAYQEYASDLLANAKFKMMSLEERGLFFTMRMECWVNSSLPLDLSSLARYLGLEVIELEKSLSAGVLSFFKTKGDELICPELEDYKAKLIEKHLKMAEGGKKGGKATQNNHKQNKASLEATLKPLSRSELNRIEMSQDELSQYAPTISINENSTEEEFLEWERQNQKYEEAKERLGFPY
jgi:uncharacterized protein YdaU (DUF1376 family)